MTSHLEADLVATPSGDLFIPSTPSAAMAWASSLLATLCRCPLCNEQFDRSNHSPRLLGKPGCGHVMCSDCLNTADRCARCHAAVHRGGLAPCEATLQVMDNLCEIIQMGERSEASSNGSYLCDVCDPEDNSLAVRACPICQTFLCDIHATSHSRSRHTKTHELQDLKTMTSEALVALEASRPSHCRRHPDQILSLFCQPCRTPICATCASKPANAAKHFHGGHVTIPLVNAATEASDLLKPIVHEFSAIRHSLTANLDAKLEEIKNELNTQYEKSTQEINSHFDELVAAIQKRREELLLAAMKEKQTRMNSVEALHDLLSLRIQLINNTLHTLKGTLKSNDSATIVMVGRAAPALLHDTSMFNGIIAHDMEAIPLAYPLRLPPLSLEHHGELLPAAPQPKKSPIQMTSPKASPKFAQRFQRKPTQDRIPILPPTVDRQSMENKRVREEQRIAAAQKQETEDLRKIEEERYATETLHCRLCEKSYRRKENHDSACVRHSGKYRCEKCLGTDYVMVSGNARCKTCVLVKLKWQCCKSEDPKEPGCTRSAHQPIEACE